MEHAIREPALNLYNPAAKDPDTLLAEFIDRKNLLARVLNITRRNTPDKPPQHVIVVGPRGMGKTTLLCAIRYSIQNNDMLNQEWLPLQFNEEQYGIGDLADFWLTALRHLEIELKSTTSRVDQLLNAASEKLAQHAQDAFFELLAQSGKRALLLIDNINDLFTAIDDGIALNQLRALWMTDARMMVIGATPSYFDEITTVDQAFHDFFRIFHLDRLTQQELEAFLRHFAHIHGDRRVIQTIEQEPQRVAAMRILTGGNPRLVMLGYRVLREGLDSDVRHDLERLLDECTPFFKHRIESLPKEARRTFDAIAQRWDPVAVDDIRTELRKPSNYISAQIRRLITEEFIEEVSGEKKKHYQVSERFYNVYYLMRYSREGRRRLRWLVNFMQVFYTRQDYKHWAKRLGDELAQPLTEPQRMEKLSLLQTMSMAADGSGKHAAFEAMMRDAIAHNDRSTLDETLADSDPVEQYGYLYFTLEIAWQLPPEIRPPLEIGLIVPWLEKLRQTLVKEHLIEKIENHLKTSEYWHTRTVDHAIAIGVILNDIFDQKKEAEVAFREAIEFDPQDVSVWTVLGILLNSQGHHTDAENTYRKAIELDPQFVHAWHGLGNALDNQDRYTEAEAAFRKVTELDPQNTSAWNMLGIELYHQGRYTEAEATCRKIIELDPQNTFAWNTLWAVLRNQGHYTDAETAYRKAIELDPQYTFAKINLAGLYLVDLNKPEEGIVLLLQSLSLDSDNRYGRYVLNHFWREALPVAAQQITADSTAQASDNLCTVITETLLVKAAGGEHAAVLEALMTLDEHLQQPFEVLILALRTLDDRSVLHHIAREKRDVVLDVIARIAPDDDPDKNTAKPD